MGGVVEGVALQALFTTLAHASLKISHFKPRLNRLRATLLLIHHQNCFDDPSILPHKTKAFIDLLVKTQRLVDKCTRARWNVFKRLYYSYKLSELEASLMRVFQIDVAILHYAKSKNISRRMSRLEDRIDEISRVVLKGTDAIKFLKLSAGEGEQQLQTDILGSFSQDFDVIDPHCAIESESMARA